MTTCSTLQDQDRQSFQPLTNVKISAAHVFLMKGFLGVFGVFVVFVIDESIGSLEDKESKRVSESGRDGRRQ